MYFSLITLFQFFVLYNHYPDFNNFSFILRTINSIQDQNHKNDDSHSFP